MSKYYYNKDYFETIDTIEKAYWLGFLYADGSINRFYTGERLRSMTLDIGLCFDDKEHLEKFAKCIETNVPVRDRVVRCNGVEHLSSRLQINNTKLCYDLIDKGCTPSKTFNVKFPTDKQVPRSLKKYFILGVFDGDGCIFTDDNSKQIVITITGLSDFLQEICDFLISDGVLRKNCLRRNKNVKRGGDPRIGEIRIQGRNDIYEILTYLYDGATIMLDRKYKKYKDYYAGFEPRVPGVSRCKSGLWMVTIMVSGKEVVVGRFDTYNEAVAARKDAEICKMNSSPLHLKRRRKKRGIKHESPPENG